MSAQETVVRLDLDAFEELVTGAATDHPALAVPWVPGALEVVRGPVAHLGIDVAGPRLVQQHHAWVGRELVVLLLVVRAEEHQLLAVPPALLGAGLARVLRVGPRRTDPGVVRETRPVAEELLVDLFHDDEVRRRSAYAGVAADLAWHLTLSWPGGEQVVAAVDGPGGPAWVVPDPGAGPEPRLEPTTPTEVWRVLSSLLGRVELPADDLTPA